MHQGQMLISEFKASLPTAFLLGELNAVRPYISLVKENGLWDYKNRNSYRKLAAIEAFGNFAFGATAAAWADGFTGGLSNGLADLTINIAKRGAGYYQKNEQPLHYQSSFGHWLDLALFTNTTYGDSPADGANIELGGRYYFSGRFNLLQQP